MNRLKPDRLHVRLLEGTTAESPIVERRYTLTHSDRTGDLFLTIGTTHDLEQISGWYTRLMRDEVLAEWQEQGTSYALHVHCHVSGGFILGSARFRDAIFRHELPLVLEAFHFGDRGLLERHPELENSPISIHFHARQPRYDRVEAWGTIGDYA